MHVHLSFYRQSGLFEADARLIWSRQAGDFAKTMKPLVLHGLRFDLGQTDKKKLLHLLETSGFELTFLPPDEFLSLVDDLAADLERLGASLSKSTGGKTASE